MNRVLSAIFFIQRRDLNVYMELTGLPYMLIFVLLLKN